MTLGERIKKARKALDLTQQRFAEQIGTTQNTIANYEIGHRSPSAAALNNICKTFNVNEEWLRTGEGEMFVPSPNGVLDELAQKYSLSTRGKVIIEKFLDLKPDIQEAIAAYIEEVAVAFSDTGTPAAVPVLAPIGQEGTEVDIAAKVAELERQNRELAAKVAAMEEEDDIEAARLHSASAGSFSSAEKEKKISPPSRAG